MGHLSVKGKWREISAKMDAVGTNVKEKTNTWIKRCEENVKRETELYKMVEAAVMDENKKRKRTDQRSAGAASKGKGRGGRSKRLDRRDATQLRRSPEQKLRIGTEAGPCSLGIHRSFRQRTRTSEDPNDKSSGR